MFFTRSIAAAALAVGCTLYASPTVLASSSLNEVRAERRAHCQNDAPKVMKGDCMKQTAQFMRDYRSAHRECLSNPAMTKTECDAVLEENLQSLLNSTRGQD